ncbi:MAG: TlpA family protein disulfide reductase [Gemmatimonadetes bacterium]|uniref:TlpA family protein disulfide reductase n=1 Tax=Candidatus Kutchimonas denitrificans TaxID=3056748 RepID=A0AAE4Z4U5_9BACT|nr:TlpA family protein disulfide reductase [Gemmatimonadota bacterium]NIR73553.1 TlpA family protein disulfide reductase [Candidatus Kutchimonas denitrificans]NIR99512.1 TlpA family protein disulfide reductase [Gemmatimonadota bacterium]NIT65132.1 TlpA family protein disulfide reductase [Gemmatimonadota bacterium]NIV23665.1 redoxin family protein [Gemmatimonadota bacterium]
MNGLRWYLLSLLMIVAPFVSSVPASAQEVIGLPVGAEPEAVRVEDLDGDPVDLGRYIGTGKPVLLEFWATWCTLCAALEPRMLAASARYGDAVQFVVVAVAVNQSPRRVRRHVEEHEMPGPVFYDAAGAAVRAFRAPTTSYVVVLDGEGKVVYTGLGEDQDIEAAIEKALEPGR